ncbi:ankyrin repeat domain-containing protein [Gaiella sp.]|uniref:ankyrin repeat domain-containing protein n=1 Tax=Gaiella sp. TaxID=2663207 RepID=UPI002E372B07|nr:ankyrin repeat domain-containing protein [Gaiella sp.]HEX5582568.1 ankyrin repeat domain-containing protein [Gaiella sp.]
MEASAEAFVLAATGGQRTRAEAMLAARPEIADDPWAALTLGHGWHGDSNEPGGPRGWAPLLYVCHSCFPSPALAGELLEGGADPNASFENEYGSMSALYGAAGVAHDPELTRVLLEAGADPNDGESVYHATESRSTACLELLLAHGAETRGTNALAHALDDERLEHVRLLLEAGADPNEHAHVAHAVRRGRGPEVVRLLADHGAELDRPGGETWRGNVPLRTPYQHARLRGRDDVAGLLEELGASTEIVSADAAVESLARGERPTTPLPETFDVDQQEVIVLAALRGKLDRVVEAVGPDFHGVVGGSPEGSLLQHAAWVGDAALVERLLALGAAPDGALGWAAHGSRNHGAPGREYVAVAELLVAAGAEPEPGLLDDAEGPLYAWLEERVNEA